MLQWDYKKEKWLRGWYNGYTQKIYKKNKYDYQLTKERVNSDIEKSVIKLKENPKYACNFFYEKVTSQWNNPTFQCFWIYSKRKSAPAWQGPRRSRRTPADPQRPAPDSRQIYRQWPRR